MDPAFSIRGALPRDFQGILDCLRQAFAPYQQSYTAAAFADTVPDPESLRRRLREMHVLVAANAANRVAGTIAYGVQGSEGHVRGMAVRPDCQGSGVAAALLEQVESELRGLNCRSVTLDTTRPLSRAIRFYERCGFRQIGAAGSFFGMALLSYRKDL